MARLLTVFGIQECLHQIPCHTGTDSAPSHAEDIHVIILDTLLRGEMIVDQAGAHAFGFVGANRGTDAASADCNTSLNLPGDHGEGQGSNIVGIVIARIQFVGPKINDLMTGGLELSHQFLLELKSTVIGCKSYAHKKRLMTPLSKARGKH